MPITESNVARESSLEETGTFQGPSDSTTEDAVESVEPVIAVDTLSNVEEKMVVVRDSGDEPVVEADAAEEPSEVQVSQPVPDSAETEAAEEEGEAVRPTEEVIQESTPIAEVPSTAAGEVEDVAPVEPTPEAMAALLKQHCRKLPWKGVSLKLHLLSKNSMVLKRLLVKEF